MLAILLAGKLARADLLRNLERSLSPFSPQYIEVSCNNNRKLLSLLRQRIGVELKWLRLRNPVEDCNDSAKRDDRIHIKSGHSRCFFCVSFGSIILLKPRARAATALFKNQVGAFAFSLEKAQGGGGQTR